VAGLAQIHGRPLGPESSETTHYSIVDSDGNAAAVTYTLNFGYGNGVTVPGLGFLLNDEMDDFAAKPGEANAFGLVQGEANAIQPRKRPLSSMTPTIVTRDGKLDLVLGTPGGPTIINTVLEVLLNVVDFGMNVQDAVDFPRIHHQWRPDETMVEAGIPPEMVKALEAGGIKVVADVSTDPGQLDFSGAVLKVKQSGADAVFVYTNEEESARALRELKKQSYDKPVIGETTLTSQKVIELAGDAANGAIAHVGLTADAPQATIKAFDEKFQKEFKYKSDHNGLKGYSAIYVVKAVTEKNGNFDQKAFAATMHGVKLSAKDYPGVLLDVSFDQNGDLDRESYMTQVVNGKQQVIATLPPASAK